VHGTHTVNSNVENSAQVLSLKDECFIASLDSKTKGINGSEVSSQL
jgi:hypothetical protein